MTKTRNRRGNFLGTVFGAAIVLVAVTLPGRAFAQFSNGTITGWKSSARPGSAGSEQLDHLFCCAADGTNGM